MTTTTKMIRATQGHSIRGGALDDDAMLARVSVERARAELRYAVHGTSLRAWETIKTEGLLRMRRRHVHLAAALPGVSPFSAQPISRCNISTLLRPRPPTTRAPPAPTARPQPPP